MAPVLVVLMVDEESFGDYTNIILMCSQLQPYLTPWTGPTDGYVSAAFKFLFRPSAWFTIVRYYEVHE